MLGCEQVLGLGVPAALRGEPSSAGGQQLSIMLLQHLPRAAAALLHRVWLGRLMPPTHTHTHTHTHTSGGSHAKFEAGSVLVT